MYGELTSPGIVLSMMPVGEYDRRVSILTQGEGRISAFARGARRATSQFAATTLPFTYGEFTLNERRDSYDLKNVENVRSFNSLCDDIEGTCYGTYFCEIMEYLTRENADESEQMKLLYMTLLALSHDEISNRLIKCIFEIRAIANYGEAMKAEGMYYSGKDDGLIEFNAPGSRKVNTSTLHAVQYIESVPVSKLFSFSVTDEVLCELEFVSSDYLNRHIDRQMKSLEVLKQMII
ncbi:MAG: DNA repair protein RecO [Lachnospiraceae bacterium]|nr:DNA repair protein RecO [Lachnospiraceae bacterium]